MKKKVVICITLVFLVCLGFIIFNDKKEVIALNDEQNTDVNNNDEYSELGDGAKECFLNYCDDITDDLIINDEVDTNVIEEYNDEYEINYKNIEEKNYSVVDDILPSLALKDSNLIQIGSDGNYEEGFETFDSYDVLPVDKVTIRDNVNTSQSGMYNISYTVKDEAGNVEVANRIVKGTKPINFDTLDKTEYIKNLEEYIKSKKYKVSLGYVNLNTGYTYLYNDNVVYYGASLVKTVGALYVYEKLDFNETTRENVEKAISISDNPAHSKIVNLIGINKLRAYGRNLGANIFLAGSNSDYYGNTTVNDQIAIWKYLYNFVNTNSKGKELQKYFINDFYNSLLFDGIPTTMHKYGLYSSYYHESGIVYADNPYLVVILTRHGDDDYKSVVQDLSQKIYGLNRIDN